MQMEYGQSEIVARLKELIEKIETKQVIVTDWSVGSNENYYGGLVYSNGHVSYTVVNSQ